MKEDIEIDLQNPEFQSTLKLIQFTRNSVFLTGKAGTGKSTLLKYICSHTRKKHVVLAPTGIAAINAGGSTLHSFFKLPFHPLLPDDPRFSFRKLKEFLKYNSAHQKLVRETELIIIDEISMVRADIIDFIDRILRLYSRNLREPFGGKQLLLVGDIFQLEPVVKADEREILNRYYPTPYFFSAKVFQEMRLVSIELKKVYRQQDAAFIAVLDHIRTNQTGSADLQLLNSRWNRTNDDKLSHGLNITLATRRDNVDFINRRKLSEIDTESTLFKGEIQGEFPESSLPTLMELELKPGAQVIFVKNDQDKRWVNGTLGTVSAIDEKNGHIYVVTEDGTEMDVTREVWSNMRYTYNEQEKKIEEEELGVFRQFPLRLAWAITIHKSQGLTFRKVTIDFTGGVFAGGQVYVALSRCTSLEGICLKKDISRSDIFVKPEIIRFAQQFNDEKAIEQAMKKAKELDVPISLHEEDPAYIKQPGVNQGKVSEQLNYGGASYLAEAVMVKRDCELAVKTGAKVDIQHISSGVAVDYVEEAKEKGANVYAEASPHHFTLTEEAVLKYGTLARMNPPLRTEEDRQRIIKGLQEGTIEIIATDHAPHSKEEKDKPLDQAPSGITGIETSLALGVTELVEKGYLSMMQLLEKMTINPAKLYNMEQGRLQEGKPADVVLFDPQDEWEVKEYKSKATNSPFTGWKLKGKVKYTICDGKIIEL